MPVRHAETEEAELSTSSIDWLCLPAEAGSVEKLRAAARRSASALGAGPKLQQGVALAVSEAATNVVQHAYREATERGEVRLEIAIDEQARLCVSIADDGLGMSPRSDSPGIGLGLPLMSQLADDVEVRIGPGTTVVMRFPLEAE
jgi:anti-sigma regulatory factor (Ser/Thr protein kinase)